MREGLRTRSPWVELKGQTLLGDERFVKKVKRLLRGRETLRETLKEIPRAQRYATRRSLEELFLGIAGKGKERRDRAICESCIKHGYTMKEIAECPGLHYATVSRRIKRAEGKDKM